MFNYSKGARGLSV